MPKTHHCRQMHWLRLKWNGSLPGSTISPSGDSLGIQGKQLPRHATACLYPHLHAEAFVRWVLVQAIDIQGSVGGDVNFPVDDSWRDPLSEWNRSAAIKLMG